MKLFRKEKQDGPKFTNIDNHGELIKYKIKRKIKSLYIRSKATKERYKSWKRRKSGDIELFTDMFSAYINDKCIIKREKTIEGRQLVENFNLYIEKMYPNQIIIFNEDDFLKYLSQKYRSVQIDQHGNVKGITCVT